ncbi:MAG: hypothetical protein CM1200mP2_34450 [Planctomycetaceae bacterium]|nr:MAG: hypothetical protein CM1200mP2_34450 [Planctomycetaceae bacterium]
MPNPLTTIDLADLPLPNWAADAPGQSVASRINDVDVSFEDQAHRAGVVSRDLNGGDPTPTAPGFMFEMTEAVEPLSTSTRTAGRTCFCPREEFSTTGTNNNRC